MKTIPLTINDTLLAALDRVVAETGTRRSHFIRSALQAALHQHKIEKMEARHAAGYQAQPASHDEFFGH